MQTLDFKIAGRRAKSFSEDEERLARHHTWVAVAVGGGALLGAGASVYGANKQSKAVQDAASKNNDAQAAQNAAAWSNYLMTRGVNPAGAATGQIPQGAQAINARLPLWATANFKRPGTTAGWRKKGSVGAPNTLYRGGGMPAGAIPDPVAPAGSSGGNSRLKDALIGNPLGIGGKDRSFFDPLGIF